MKEPSKPSFFVGIKDPRELRRNILEASKSVIGSMQKQQRVLEIQKEKKLLKGMLNSDIKELKMLFLKLEKTLPEQAFETAEKTLPKLQEKKPLKPLPKSFSQQSDIDKLHAHLEMVEQRLKKLK